MRLRIIALIISLLGFLANVAVAQTAATSPEKSISLSKAQKQELQQMLDTSDRAIQLEAINTLRQCRHNDALPLLKNYLKNSTVQDANYIEAEKAVKYFEHQEKNASGIQNLFSGLSLGSILILVALGLSIIYGLARIINMAHGEFMMIGAYTTFCMQQLFVTIFGEGASDIAWFASLPISFLVSAMFGLAVERLVIRHLYNRPLESLLATWGISLILIQLVRTIFGDLTTVKSPACLAGSIDFESGVSLPYNRLFIMGLTAVVFVAVVLVFQKTRLGIKIRAVTQNRNMAAAVGISTSRIDMLTFAIGSGLAGLAGCAITLIGNVVPDMGQTYIVDSFIVVVTGGVGKLAGTVVSGLGIGIFSKIFEGLFEAVYGKVLILLLVIVFLQKRPQGIFRDKGRVGED